MSSPATGADAPRRRDAARTRARILIAAQQIFSERDYTQARMADIAALAGVNQALVARYYGSKDRLFAVALADLLKSNSVGSSGVPLDGPTIVDRLLGGEGMPRDPLPMVIHATSDRVARAIARDLMEEEILAPLARALGPPEPQARAAEILALCAGVFTYRTLLPLAPFASSMDPAARLWLEASLQSVIDRSVD